MSKPRNKSLLKVGDMVFHPEMGAHRVAELTPLNNKVLFAVLDLGDNDTILCTGRNAKDMICLKPMDEYMVCNFYLDSHMSDREKQRLHRQDQQREIGYAAMRIFYNLTKK